MKQFFPGATDGGAGYPLGTKVVTFRVQNGKLFVFDASDNNKTSDQFDPTLIIEAYPIVTDLGRSPTRRAARTTCSSIPPAA